MNKTQLKKHLETLTNEQLINQITDLYSKFKDVKEFFDGSLDGDNGAVISKYKKIIDNQFFPQRGFPKFHLSIARKAVTDFKKVASSEKDVAEIMIYYVEQGTKGTCAYGDIDMPFYDSLISMYSSALKLMAKIGNLNEYKSRCYELVQKTSGIGWGFHDDLGDLYDEYFVDQNKMN